MYALTIDRRGSKLQQANGRFDGLRVGRNKLTGNGATLEMLTAALATQLGRPVVDQTGLNGTFEFNLEWTAQLGADAPADTGGPSIFTAVQEQLGLKLESTKGPVKVLVIDRAATPSAN